MINKEFIKFNLAQAKEKLDETLKNIENDPEFSDVEFQMSLELIYHHLNFSWNARDVAEKRAINCSNKDYTEWSKFPVDELNEYE
ncbi:MAG: hypothetical protein COA95_02390 [Methylophaga sp.]|nr:MAG: hypothetical protein COA95_02390 [Methylophaga sp.]